MTTYECLITSKSWRDINLSASLQHNLDLSQTNKQPPQQDQCNAILARFGGSKRVVEEQADILRASEGTV